MNRHFTCPHCQTTLNPGTKIIVIGSHEDGREGLILFDPQPGNYDTILPEALTFQSGENCRFTCPICRKDLTSKEETHLATVNFQSEDGTSGTVYFSRVFGEKATYFVTRESIEKYGENADLYGTVNFFGAGRNDF